MKDFINSLSKKNLIHLVWLLIAVVGFTASPYIQNIKQTATGEKEKEIKEVIEQGNKELRQIVINEIGNVKRRQATGDSSIVEHIKRVEMRSYKNSEELKNFNRALNIITLNTRGLNQEIKQIVKDLIDEKTESNLEMNNESCNLVEN